VVNRASGRKAHMPASVIAIRRSSLTRPFTSASRPRSGSNCEHELHGPAADDDRTPAAGAARPPDAHAVFAGRRERFPLPDISMCLAVAITHSPAIDAVSVASMAALPVTRAMTPAASASAPMAEASTT